MNRDDIIRMAREAGAEMFSHASVFSANDIERFAALVAAAEREACASKPLTDKEIEEIVDAEINIHEEGLRDAIYMIIRMVEAAHNILD